MWTSLYFVLIFFAVSSSRTEETGGRSGEKADPENEEDEEWCPYFGSPMANVTVPLGREAVLTCIVRNLGQYKEPEEKREGMKKKDATGWKISDFQLMSKKKKRLFGWEVVACRRDVRSFHSLRIMPKELIFSKRAVKYVMRERALLKELDFLFTTKLDLAFQDLRNLYLCTPFFGRGTLSDYLEEEGSFDEKTAMFYLAQVILALEYLHRAKGLVYRSLKAENLTLDERGYVRLTNFGLCKEVQAARTYTLCGSPECMAPEMLACRGYGLSVDWWALGVLTYHLAAGYLPFQSKNDIELNRLIMQGKYVTPDTFSPKLSSFVSCLLERNVSKRLGCLKKGPEDVKEHPWITEVNWPGIWNKSERAPLTPIHVDTDQRMSSEEMDHILGEEIEKDPYRTLFLDF